jgi:hypothetical protein
MFSNFLWYVNGFHVKRLMKTVLQLNIHIPLQWNGQGWRLLCRFLVSKCRVRRNTNLNLTHIYLAVCFKSYFCWYVQARGVSEADVFIYLFFLCLFSAFLLKGTAFKCEHRQTTLSAKQYIIYKHFIYWSKTLTDTEVDQYVGTQIYCGSLET